MLTLALYGGVLAVDGGAPKQAVNAWAHAPETEKARASPPPKPSGGFAVLLVAVAVAWTASITRPIAYLMALSGLTYLWQGWLAGSEGFSPMHSLAIVLAEVLNLTWMIWLFVVARRMQNLEPASPISMDKS